MGTVLGEKVGRELGAELEQKGKLWLLNREFSRTYYVVADTDSETEDSIRGSAGIPPLFLITNGAVCKKHNVKETGQVAHPITGVSTTLYEVTCHFDTKVDSEDDQSPENKNPEIRWYAEQDEEVLEEDAITGDPIRTVPGEPIILTHPVPRPILEITRYELSPFPPLTILQYMGRTNSKTFYGAPEGTALMMDIRAEREFLDDGNGNQIPYERVSYIIKFRIVEKDVGNGFEKDTWKTKTLHEGTLYLESPTSVEAAQYKIDGDPARTNLDEDGAILGPNDDPYYLRFNRFQKVDFNKLNLGPF